MDIQWVGMTSSTAMQQPTLSPPLPIFLPLKPGCWFLDYAQSSFITTGILSWNFIFITSLSLSATKEKSHNPAFAPEVKVDVDRLLNKMKKSDSQERALTRTQSWPCLCHGWSPRTLKNWYQTLLSSLSLSFHIHTLWSFSDSISKPHPVNHTLSPLQYIIPEFSEVLDGGMLHPTRHGRGHNLCSWTLTCLRCALIIWQTASRLTLSVRSWHN